MGDGRRGRFSAQDCKAFTGVQVVDTIEGRLYRVSWVMIALGRSLEATSLVIRLRKYVQR